VKKVAKKVIKQGIKVILRAVWTYVIIPIVSFIVATWYIWLIIILIIFFIILILYFKEHPEELGSSSWTFIKYYIENIFQ